MPRKINTGSSGIGNPCFLPPLSNYSDDVISNGEAKQVVWEKDRVLTGVAENKIFSTEAAPNNIIRHWGIKEQVVVFIYRRLSPPDLRGRYLHSERTDNLHLVSVVGSLVYDVDSRCIYHQKPDSRNQRPAPSRCRHSPRLFCGSYLSLSLDRHVSHALWQSHWVAVGFFYSRLLFVLNVWGGFASWRWF